MAQQEATTEELANLLDGRPEEIDKTPTGFEDSEEGGGEDGVDTEDFEAKDPPDKEGGQAEVAAEEPKERAKTETVPYGRFERILAERNDAVAAQAKSNQQLTEIVKAQQEFLARQNQPPLPDPDEDPEAFQKHQLDERDAKLSEQETELERFRGQRKAVDEHQELQAFAVKQEAEFIGEYPQYHEAITFGKNAAVKVLMNQGHSPESASMLVEEEIRTAAVIMKEYGGNFAKWAYSKAEQYGFKPEQNEAGESEQVETDAAAEKKKELAKAADKKAKVQEANKSVATAGAGVVPDLQDMDVDDMNDEQFKKFKAQLFQQNNPLRA